MVEVFLFSVALLRTFLLSSRDETTCHYVSSLLLMANDERNEVCVCVCVCLAEIGTSYFYTSF